MVCNNILCQLFINDKNNLNCMKNHYNDDDYSYIKCNKFKIHFLEVNDILLIRVFIDRIIHTNGDIHIPKKYVKNRKITKNQYVYIKEPFIELDDNNDIFYLATEVSPFIYNSFNKAEKMKVEDIRLKFIVLKNAPTYCVFRFLKNDNLSVRHLKDWQNDWCEHNTNEVQKLIF